MKLKCVTKLDLTSDNYPSGRTEETPRDGCELSEEISKDPKLLDGPTTSEDGCCDLGEDRSWLYLISNICILQSSYFVYGWQLNQKTVACTINTLTCQLAESLAFALNEGNVFSPFGRNNDRGPAPIAHVSYQDEILSPDSALHVMCGRAISHNFKIFLQLQVGFALDWIVQQSIKSLRLQHCLAAQRGCPQRRWSSVSSDGSYARVFGCVVVWRCRNDASAVEVFCLQQYRSFASFALMGDVSYKPFNVEVIALRFCRPIHFINTVEIFGN